MGWEFCAAEPVNYDPRFYQTAGWCSNHNDWAPDLFKAVVCPNEDSCGNGGHKFIEPPLDGEVITTAPSRHGDNLFLNDDICSYVIKNPAGMAPRDWMWVEVSEVDRCEVVITKAYDYKYKLRNPLKNASNKRFGMLRGLDYYVIAHSLSVFVGNYKMQTWIERADPPPGSKPDPQP